MEVVEKFFELWAKSFPKHLSYNRIAKLTKVFQPIVRRYVKEFETRGRLLDPEEQRSK